MIYRVLISLAISWVVVLPAPATADVGAVGVVDVVTQTSLRGWARDDDCPACAVSIHFYIDGAFKGAVLADQFRLGQGAHGFYYQIPPLPSGAHSAIAYAIGIASNGVPTGVNPPLGAPRTLTTQERRADFNGDGITEPAVYRRSGGTWWASGVFSAVQWGLSEDVPVAADYDGDGRSDLAVYRPSNGVWYVVRSSDGAADVRGPYGGGSYWVGVGGHVPVPGDYNGDGRAEPAVFRTTDSTWHAWGVHGGVQWGLFGDVPVPGDYDGDGRTDIAVFRPSNNAWYVIQSASGQAGVFAGWGESGDVPVPADYDGDGRTDVAVFRPSTGQWWVINSATGSMGVRAVHGGPGDVPTPADFNGDQLTDIAVFRPSNGTWYVATYGTWQWGLPGDIPAAHQLQYFQIKPPSCGDGLPVGTPCGGGVCGASGLCSTQFLRAGESLLPGQCRSSHSGRFELCYRADGFLAFTENRTLLWSLPEVAVPPGRATLQASGNLIVSSAGGGTVWESGDLSADLHGAAALQLLDTGAIAIDQEDNLEQDPPPPPNQNPNTCDIELFSRHAFHVPIGVHDVVRITRRDAAGNTTTRLLNMQGGDGPNCSNVTCNKEASDDGCNQPGDPFHDTHWSWGRTGLSQNLCDACAEAYLKDVGYHYELADSNCAVNDCIHAIQRIDPSFDQPPLKEFRRWWDPYVRVGRDCKLGSQGGVNPEVRCVEAYFDLGCERLLKSACPTVCGTPETHLCDYCPDAPGCGTTCPSASSAQSSAVASTRCGCSDEPNHPGTCGNPDDCGHVGGASTDCGCPSEANHPGRCGIPDACGHVEGASTDCDCPGEPNHPGTCGNADACGHVTGSPSDPGCQPVCVPGTSCSAQGFNCGQIWDGCDWVSCGDCNPGFACTPEQHCACTETTNVTCGWVTLCGRPVFLGECNPTCASTCGQHPNDVCQPDGSCTCIGTCDYPMDCGNSDGCGNTCDTLCGPCGDSDGNCYDDCTLDWVCGDGGGGDSGGGSGGGGGGDLCSSRPGCWMCGGPGGCAYESGSGGCVAL